jgi:molecular chaperone Hsp33
MAQKHGLSGAGARGLGEAVLGSLLLASYCKPGERVNLNVQGSGRLKQAIVDAYPEGVVRGYVIERPEGALRAASPEREGPWGQGVLSVLKTKNEEGGKPYIGTVPLITGHLAKDLSFYWYQSEQIPSSVGLAVETGPDDQVTTAGAFLVQAMPGASDTDLKAIEAHINDIQGLAKEFAHNADPMSLLSALFQDTAFVVLEERPIRFECNCSEKRVERTLVLLGVEELRQMLKEDNKAVVRCDFCTKEYVIGAADLERMIAKR